MRHPRPVIGSIVAGLGALIALVPVVSVWQAAGQSLAALPSVAVTSDDTRHPLAFRDPEFVLATRTFGGASAAQVEAVLRQDGYRPTEARGAQWLSKDCCGQSDAVWVHVEDGPGDTAVATMTVADADVRSSWPLFAVVGASLAVGGVALAVPRRRQPADRRPSPAVGPAGPGLSPTQ